MKFILVIIIILFSFGAKSQLDSTKVREILNKELVLLKKSSNNTDSTKTHKLRTKYYFFHKRVYRRKLDKMVNEMIAFSDVKSIKIFLEIINLSITSVGETQSYELGRLFSEKPNIVLKIVKGFNSKELGEYLKSSFEWYIYDGNVEIEEEKVKYLVGLLKLL